MPIFLTFCGILLLMVAGDALVRGAIGLSLKLGLSATVISVTVVALGTSAPELVISIKAALEGSPDIALGNVVGSNIANILLIVGAPALIVPLVSSSQELRRTYGLMLGATALFSLIALTGEIGRASGLVLLASLVLVLVYLYLKARAENGETLAAEPSTRGWEIAALLLGGIAILPFGAYLLIDGARGIALYFGLSEAAIGLTIVALGTSLPELAASLAAVSRGRSDVALGNVIGSNIFNLLAVIGATAVISPLDVSRVFLTVDIPLMVVISLLLAPFLIWKVRLGRRYGLAFLVLYAIFSLLALGDASI